MEMRADLIAPCGMNCRLCMVHQLGKKPCPGCGGPDADKPKHCTGCVIALCDTRRALPGELCCDCKKRCGRMKYMDANYRKKYGVSLLENQRSIRDRGMETFLKEEEARWKCENCGGVLCVHENTCPVCGAERATDIPLE